MKAFSLTRFTSGWIPALLLLVLTGCGSDSNPINPTATRSNLNQVNSANSTVPNHVFSATLTGAEEVPLVNTAATATGVVVVDPETRQMKATVVTADIAGTAAHIHAAPRGVSGPVALQLTESSSGSGIWTASTVLSVEQLNTLRAGSFYFNVHSAAFPDGEIRGQILVQLPKSGSAIPASGTSTTTSTSGTTTGATGGSGTGTTSAGASTASIVASGTADTTTSNATTPGNTAKSVNNSTMSSSVNDNSTGSGTSGTSSGSTRGIASTGSGTTSTAANTVAATRPLFFTNVMTGALAVPPTSSTATAATITVYRPRDRVLTSVIVSSGITGTGASLRQGAAGTVGPVINSLRETTQGSGIWIARTTLTGTQGTALTGGNLYYEITSTAFLQGELRGQIVATAGTRRAASASTTGTTTGTTTGITTGTTTGTPTGGTTGTATGITNDTTSTAATAGTTTGTATPTTTVTPITTLSGVGTVTPGTTGVVSPPAP
jgi:hypothetical protein